MEDEIDLRKYIYVLLKHWKLIAIITGAAVIVAGLVSFLSPSLYEAKAFVLVAKGRSELVLEPRYQSAFQQVDSTSFQQTLLALIKSSMVADQVIEQLGGELGPGERKTDRLLKKLQVSNEGDLIKISVKSTNAQKAADIANAWAKTYQSHVNVLYNDKTQLTEQLSAQADIAAKEYKERQKVLENFIKDNHIAELSQQINDKEILYDVKLLREHVKSGSAYASSTANSLALVLLQTRAFTSLPEGLQISLDSLSGPNDVTLSDIDALASTLEARAGGKHAQSLTELRKDILLLRAELEQENARQQELQSARDIAWEACTAIAGKRIEVSAKTQNIMITVAEFASLPESPVAPRKVMNIGIALVLGVVAGIFGAFGLEYFSKTR